MSRAPQDVVRFGFIAPRLVRLGFQPIPLYPENKNPAVTDWRNYHFDRIKRDDRSCLIRQGAAIAFPNFDTGIVTGTCIGLDIDVRDERIVRRLKKLAGTLLGPGPDRVGSAPKFLRVYRTDKPFPKIRSKNFSLPGDRVKAKGYKFHAIEVLADGQQFAAFGIHNGTKRPYQWSTPGGLLAIPLLELTAVTEAQFLEYVAAAERMLLKCGAKAHGRTVKRDSARKSPTPKGVAPEALQARDPAACRQALAAIPNLDEDYEIWWRVGLACAAALGESGRKDFLAWSRRSAKHDTDNKGKPVLGYSDKAYTGFLKYCASGKSQITAGSIFHMAREAGWQPPDPRIGIARLWRRTLSAHGMLR
jgi:hypothetical protein